MKKDSDMLKNLREYLANMTEAEKEEMLEFFRDDTPKGWVSIEEHLPHFKIGDFEKGYSEYRVKDKDGNESPSRVTDHHMWYYMAKDAGVTHWYNE